MFFFQYEGDIPYCAIADVANVADVANELKQRYFLIKEFTFINSTQK